MIKYCLHPGSYRVKIVKKADETGVPLKWDWANRYVTAEELARMYGVDLEECVVFDPRKQDLYVKLIHLRVDLKNEYRLPDTVI